jgi:hypothetical protein
LINDLLIPPNARIPGEGPPSDSGLGTRQTPYANRSIWQLFTHWHTKRLPSRWREFSCAFHQITAAIQPALALSDMLANWGQIAKGFAEAPRKRKSQEQKFSQTS